MIDALTIGRVTAVHGLRVKVELDPASKSPSRAGLSGVHTAVAINSYVTFEIGAGEVALGVITDLEARETYDPSSDEGMTLELTKPRRLASVQLLGTIRAPGAGETRFDPGITLLPTLETLGQVATSELLETVFKDAPRRNPPEAIGPGQEYDQALDLGVPVASRENRFYGSYNDLLSRPLAIVGNTGSGKSYTVASLIQKAMRSLGESAANELHIFILDINGEYARAFGIEQPLREPDRVYLNGREFGIPIWLLNAQEVCAWLSASEQTQEPVLKDWWAVAKAQAVAQQGNGTAPDLRHALTKIDELIECLDGKNPVKKTACRLFQIAESYLGDAEPDGVTALRDALEPYRGQLAAGRPIDWDRPENERDIRQAAQALQDELRRLVSGAITQEGSPASTADSPLPIARSALTDPSLVDRAISQEDVGRIETHLTTLKLRLRTRLDDKRWNAFLNHETLPDPIRDLQTWFRGFGLGSGDSSKVSIIDLSMLGNEVLPYACGVIGRTLLEARERLPADKRFETPWVVVLEEAHNYARPARQSEDRGQALSRRAFERVAKEGRKFGVSLIVASQRPSEISPTILSQCANFISHRLQNPDDIEHFRKIIPLQARRLLDQVTVLASGEAIVFGSAFHVSTRVQMDRPEPAPWSQTAAPYFEWEASDQRFPVTTVIRNWGLRRSRKRIRMRE